MNFYPYLICVIRLFSDKSLYNVLTRCEYITAKNYVCRAKEVGRLVDSTWTSSKDWTEDRFIMTTSNILDETNSLINCQVSTKRKSWTTFTQKLFLVFTRKKVQVKPYCNTSSPCSFPVASIIKCAIKSKQIKSIAFSLLYYWVQQRPPSQKQCMSWMSCSSVITQLVLIIITKSLGTNKVEKDIQNLTQGVLFVPSVDFIYLSDLILNNIVNGPGDSQFYSLPSSSGPNKICCLLTQYNNKMIAFFSILQKVIVNHYYCVEGNGSDVFLALSYYHEFLPF